MDLNKYQQVFEHNKNWIKKKLGEDQDYFSKLSKGQQPDFLYIGCSDSRVPANEITGTSCGDMFIHRNIANIVSSNDVNLMSVLQYSVEHLKVKHVVVCGHYGCGGVKAAMTAQTLGLLDNWLGHIRDVYRLHQKELDAIGNEDGCYRRLVELNVQEQCINLFKTSYVQESYLNNGYPTVHGWVYDLNNGLLKDLEINFDEVLKDIDGIYKLT